MSADTWSRSACRVSTDGGGVVSPCAKAVASARVKDGSTIMSAPARVVGRSILLTGNSRAPIDDSKSNSNFARPVSSARRRICSKSFARAGWSQGVKETEQRVSATLSPAATSQVNSCTGEEFETVQMLRVHVTAAVADQP